MQAVKALLDGNKFTTPESIAGEVELHQASAELKVTPEYTYKTFRYQWSQWNEDPTQRQVRSRHWVGSISTVFLGLWERRPRSLHVCNVPPRIPQQD